MTHSPGHRSSYRLLVLDIDGTLTGPDGVVSEANASAVRRLQYRGIRVSLATGRSERTTIPISRALGIQTPVITYNGGRAIDPRTGAVLMERRLRWEDALRMSRAFRVHQTSATLLMYTDSAILGLAGSALPEEWFLPQDGSVLLNMQTIGQVERYAALHPTAPPIKMVAIGPPSQIPQMGDPGLDESEERISTVQSEPYCLEILPSDSTKGSALKWLGHRLDISLKDVAAMGNAPNDVEMLRLAGLSIAVSDAHPDALRAADRAAPAGRDDAVAAVIDELFPPEDQPPLKGEARSTASA